MSNEDNRQLQRRMNPETIRVLVERGTDPKLSRPIYSVFYVNDNMSADRIAAYLKEHGYKVTHTNVYESANSAYALCAEIALDHKPSLEWLNEMTDACVDAVEGIDADYDGWYTSV